MYGIENHSSYLKGADKNTKSKRREKDFNSMTELPKYLTGYQGITGRGRKLTRQEKLHPSVDVICDIY